MREQEERQKDLLKAAEVAHMLNCSRQHVYDLGERGEIEVVIIGRMRRYMRASVQALIDRGKQ